MTPVECAKPAASEIRTSTLKTIETQRPERGLVIPRRAIIDFHGRSTRIAAPLVACRTSDHRDGTVPNENASHPVRKAVASRARSARLVRAPSLIAGAIYMSLSPSLGDGAADRGQHGVAEPDLVGGGHPA